LLLYIGWVANPMDEAIVENLSNLANLVLTDGRALMRAGGLVPINALPVAFLKGNVVRR
jgi:hypothetical protein